MRPLPRTMENDVARWPGVLKVEGFRAIPVQLGSGARTRVVSLTGLPRSGTLRRLLDAKLAPVPVPPQGLVLPRKLAALLQVGVGDVIAVQPIGSNTGFSLRVARMLEQYIGLEAYADLDALNAVLGSEPRITGT